jgi:NTP pyrophosphatase (non-canonical NTP hydrolase)
MTARLITKFADDMARELENNGHKSGWEELTVKQCLRRAEMELKELRGAIEFKGTRFETIRAEAADVGNFLAMLVWRACEDEDRKLDHA